MVGLGELWDFVVPVVDTMSAPLVNVTWPNVIQYASLSKLCVQDVYVWLPVVLLHSPPYTEGRMWYPG